MKMPHQTNLGNPETLDIPEKCSGRKDKARCEKMSGTFLTHLQSSIYNKKAHGFTSPFFVETSQLLLTVHSLSSSSTVSIFDYRILNKIFVFNRHSTPILFAGLWLIAEHISPFTKDWEYCNNMFYISTCFIFPRTKHRIGPSVISWSWSMVAHTLHLFLLF